MSLNSRDTSAGKTNEEHKYKQTEVGLIPVDWDVCDLQDAVDFLDGMRRPVKSGDRAKISGVFPYYGASGIVDYVNDYIFDDELILLGEDGENILSRNLPLAFKVSGKIWVNNHAHVLKPKSSFDITFLTEFLESLDYSLLNSGTAQPKLNKKSCLKIKIAKPALEEQTAIANALSDVDALIQELEKLIAKKQAIKTATMQQLLTGRTRLPQFAYHPDGRKKGYKPSELGEIPEDWEVCEFGSLLQEFRNGYAFSADGYEQTGIPIITMAQIGLSGCFQFDIAKVNKWDMNQLDKLKEFWVQNGDLLIAMTDVTPDKNLIGQMTIAKLDCVAFLNQRVGLLRMRSGVADATFFSFLSCLPVWKQYCRGVASLGVQANIGTTDIRKAKVYCPPIGEQAAITRILSDIDSEIQAQQHRLDKTRQIKQGMMQELLTGKTRLL